ncbi:DUF1641 domain-containing protein [Acidianus sp. HS-5]|uniref:DUF1641 domain-containing protein n=1 Tax=Acidianus sp. HS-5 TaxID=2886040 RepID=UPI001F1F4D13|nr:DUF1641 domain-containing protein [Acidianus sp. HS-5]BDC17541.1 hypothetical protein HS5_04310 [Acidianus sp. HS-5]
MEEEGVQTADELIEDIINNKEAIESLLKFVRALQRTGILPFLVGVTEKLDENLALLSEQEIVKNLSVIYGVLSGKEEVGEIKFSDIFKELQDPDVRRGIFLILKVLKAIGSANKENKP